jgi:hypothetical protein
VAESLLDLLINNSHRLHMNGASYRPRTRPGRIPDQPTTTTRNQAHGGQTWGIA